MELAVAPVQAAVAEEAPAPAVAEEAPAPTVAEKAAPASVAVLAAVVAVSAARPQLLDAGAGLAPTRLRSRSRAA